MAQIHVNNLTFYYGGNLKNAHYAMLKTGENGAVTYDVPVALPGAVSISLSANGEMENFQLDQ
ncbi:MAG: hypothetical protein MRZ63_01070 [Anaerostipes sp.]|uniref:hypothetical protein n=1 Tax=Anaerostipes sp. 992a TaxID=1261637 RepID=UPI0009527514|nr:hypothetical protein [Anaerostipes sp. 992a]MCI5950889.1 hypothetical protein [Anaerostipes sp.]MDD5968461.1 hypothetical protein [Anaerostipes sp.]OLR62337.1 hypothetical protein BHF69_06375 [Anaerostipes sp. 992a]